MTERGRPRRGRGHQLSFVFSPAKRGSGGNECGLTVAALKTAFLSSSVQLASLSQLSPQLRIPLPHASRSPASDESGWSDPQSPRRTASLPIAPSPSSAPSTRPDGFGGARERRSVLVRPGKRRGGGGVGRHGQSRVGGGRARVGRAKLTRNECFVHAPKLVHERAEHVGGHHPDLRRSRLGLGPRR